MTNLNNFSPNEQVNLLKKTASSANLRSKVHSTGNAPSLPNADFIGHVPSEYLVNSKLNSVYNNNLETGLSLSPSLTPLYVCLCELNQLIYAQ